MPSHNTASLLKPLQDEHGLYSMLAVDQRESLRAMLKAGGHPTTDAAVIKFKEDSVRLLTPYASAVLLDRQYALSAAKMRANGCALILAADVLHQEPGGPVTGASLDEGLTAGLIQDIGADALKMLVPWLPEARQQAVDLAGAFMELCRAAKVPGIVEGVVRPLDIAEWSDERRDDAIVQAAEDLDAVSPDMYKAEVPSYGKGDERAITANASRISEVLSCPWVVLSSGVSALDFPNAVVACRKGGAVGFLAGRAVWAESLKQRDIVSYLSSDSVEALKRLSAVSHKVN